MKSTTNPEDDLCPSIEDVKRAVESTGFPFELEIARRVEAQGYFVTPNYNFEDHDTGQSREIDFHAINAKPISQRREEFTFPILLGSCKANNHPYVFFTRDNPLSRIVLTTQAPISGAPLRILLPDGEETDVEWFFKFAEILHVASAKRISSQFCELSPLGTGSRAPLKPNTSVLESTVVPLIKAMAREMEEHNTRAAPTEGDEDLNYQLYYPVIVLRGPMFEYYTPPVGEPRVTATKHVVVVRHYATKALSGEYAVDAIHESFLGEYLAAIESEVGTFINRIRRHRRRLTESMRHLAKSGT